MVLGPSRIVLINVPKFTYKVSNEWHTYKLQSSDGGSGNLNISIQKVGNSSELSYRREGREPETNQQNAL